MVASLGQESVGAARRSEPVEAGHPVPHNPMTSDALLSRARSHSGLVHGVVSRELRNPAPRAGCLRVELEGDSRIGGSPIQHAGWAWGPACMARASSMDLRQRVMAAIMGGMSANAAAARFGVAVSTAVRWEQRYRQTGSAAPGQMGGHKPRRLIGAHRLWLLERCTDRHFTLRGLVLELAERGLKVDRRSVWRFVHDEGLSFKKTARRRRARPARHCPAPRAMAGPSASDRSDAPGLHRWLSSEGDQRDQDQHGAAARLGAARCPAARQGALGALEHDDIHRRFAGRPDRRAVAARRSGQWREFPHLCRAGTRANPRPRRHRHPTTWAATKATPSGPPFSELAPS